MKFKPNFIFNIKFFFIYIFRRNVFLFEPFNLGNYFNEYRSYFKEVFRVFYTPERHFDSVFTSDYIQEAAICQCEYMLKILIFL